MNSEQRRISPPLGEQWSNDKTECVGAQMENHHRKEIFAPDEERHRTSAADQATYRKTPAPDGHMQRIEADQGD
jgi:hypothetical protein